MFVPEGRHDVRRACRSACLEVCKVNGLKFGTVGKIQLVLHELYASETKYLQIRIMGEIKGRRYLDEIRVAVVYIYNSEFRVVNRA